MRYLALLLIVFVSCGTPTEPDSPLIQAGFTQSSVPGTWQAKTIVRVQLKGQNISIDEMAGFSFHPKSGKITVEGNTLSFWAQNPFNVQQTDVMYYEGTIDGETIKGHYWTDYDSDKFILNFIKVQ
jgi:hypothetical protein